MPMNPKAQQGPDPAVFDAIGRLNRSELSPLEETMFQAWAQANQIDDPDGQDGAGMDLRQTYTQTGGRVLPPGELKKAHEKSSAIKTIMDAQKAHENGSPIKAMMEAGLDPASLQQDPAANLGAGPGGGIGTGGGFDQGGSPSAPQGMGGGGPENY